MHLLVKVDLVLRVNRGSCGSIVEEIQKQHINLRQQISINTTSGRVFRVDLTLEGRDLRRN